MTYESLIQAFGARYGLDGLAPEKGSATLSIDGNKVEIIDDTDAGAAVIYAEIGYPPPDADGHFGEMMLKANHLYLGTPGGTLCQNPETGAYVLMRPVPLAPLDGAETFGKILEGVLSLVDEWQAVLGGLREAETAADKEETEARGLAIGGFMKV
jgi:hypothetical protein